MLVIEPKIHSQDSILLQKALLETVRPDIVVDGYAGKNTLEAFKTFALAHNITPPDGFTGEAFDIISKYVDDRFVRDEDYAKAAAILGCKQSHIRAISDVEARGNGFLAAGRVKMLFERHKFYKYLGIALNDTEYRKTMNINIPLTVSGTDALEMIASKNPDICNPKAGGYLGDLREHDKLEKASAFDYNAAVMSASYGMYQIMGFNHAYCGYKNAVDMFVDFSKSEKNQFMGFINFIKNNPAIHKALVAGDWLGFARGYNGKAFATNDYNNKVERAEKKYRIYNK